MKAYQIGKQDGLSSLTLVERDLPVAARGEILVQPRFACLNHRDLLTLRGSYGPRKDETRIPLSDGVGEVVSVGDGVDNFAVGDRVISPHFIGWIDSDFSPEIFANDLGISADGWLAERIKLPASAAIRLPDEVSDKQAATLASAGTTVWHALVVFGGIKPGDLLLTLGTGGVSILALQIAKALGAKVAITSSSDDKLEMARKLGADYSVNYRTTIDWPEALSEQTGGRGADIIVETAGFATLGQSIAAAAHNGRLALIGGLAGQAGDSPPTFFGIIGKNLILKGITSGSRAMLSDLLDLVAKTGMVPVVDHVFPFEEAHDAYAYLDRSGHLGKVMISV